jgi:GTP-binding protein
MKRPVIAIVGRPNVGKSTLFNRLLGRRQAIVQDIPGVTRDRHYAETEHRGRRFTLIDTGGLDPDAPAGVATQVRQQAERAIAEADAVILLFDGRDGLTALDHAVAAPLRRLTKPVLVAVNKIDSPRSDVLTAEFYELGMAPIYPIAAEQGYGVDELMEAALAALPETGPAAEAAGTGRSPPRVAVVGRPNVGKSTLINRLLGEERLVTDATPGTTRDAIDTPVEFDGKPYVFVDTAGIRRRGRIERGVERFSLARALEAIRRADVAVVVLDGAEGLVEQDTKIIGQVLKENKGCILLINKWDLAAADPQARAKRLAEAQRRLSFITHAPMRFISARTGSHVKDLFGLIDEVFAAYARRVPTGELNRAFEEAVEARHPPQTGGRHVKLYYITQTATRPPTFVIFANRPADVKTPYLRYIENFFRERFGFIGTPLKFVLRARSRRELR